MAKAQSELIGLAIVVVLIVLGLLIAISLGLRSSDVNYIVEIQNEQIPVLLNDAILEAHVGEDCYEEQIKKLLLKLAQGERFVCKDNQNLKGYLTENIGLILNETLDSWFIEYQYTIYTGLDYTDSEKYILPVFTNTDCSNKNINTENFFFSMSSGDFLNMKLDICYE